MLNKKYKKNTNILQLSWQQEMFRVNEFSFCLVFIKEIQYIGDVSTKPDIFFCWLYTIQVLNT